MAWTGGSTASSFWWHEVESVPSEHEHAMPVHSRKHYGADRLTAANASVVRLNVAINYWFEPLFTKQFPCKTCSKAFNLDYIGVKDVAHAVLLGGRDRSHAAVVEMS